VLFPNGFEDLSLHLAHFLDLRAPELLQGFFDQETQVQTQRVLRSSNGDEQTALHSMVETFEEGHFFPEVDERGRDELDFDSDPGAVTLTLFHCPVLAMAREHPEMCGYEERMIHDMLSRGPGDDVSVERPEWRLEGRPICIYRIKAPSFKP
jgi:predicted ArsR family transcriptional regulator